MNIENIGKNAVIPGFIAMDVALLSHWISLSLIGIVGFAAVLVIAGIGALDYRISFKKLIDR